METDEAKMIAEQEVITILVHEQRRNIKKEMEQACIDLEEKLRQDFIKQRKRREKQLLHSATWTLVSAVRRWQARKKLRLRCLETYEKVFDEGYQAFYYRNSKTVSLVSTLFILNY